MDILQPEIVEIDGRRYRKLPVDLPSIDSGAFRHGDAEDLFPENEEDETGFLGDTDIIPIERGGYKVNLFVPFSFNGIIVGKMGKTKANIEKRTSCSIAIPKRGQKGPVEITGRSKEDVLKAKTQIEIICEGARKNVKETHFVAIVLNNSDVMTNVATFTEMCLKRYQFAEGICPQVFQNPVKLHLTLGMLKLLCDKDIEDACKVLKKSRNVVQSFLKDQKLILQLKGLDIMTDDPKMAHVLYIKASCVDGSNRLQTVADGIVEEFVKAGMMERDFGRQNVKIHATLINSKWKDQTDSDNKPKQSHRSAVDVSGILNDFKDFDFGTVEVKNLHILTRTEFDETGSYKTLAKISFFD